jgi:hypothetical protein
MYELINVKFEFDCEAALLKTSFKDVLSLLKREELLNVAAAFSTSFRCKKTYFEPVTPADEDENETDGFKIKFVKLKSSGLSF